MTTPRALGNVAKNAVDSAAEELLNIGKELRPLQERDMTNLEKLLHISRALQNVERALRLLESIGAATRPQ